MSDNMICPACNHFQPKAVECAECGAVIAKVQQTADTSTQAPASEAEATSGGLPLPAIVVGLVLVVGAGIFLFGSREEQSEAPPKPPGVMAEATSGRLKQADLVAKRSDTQERLRALVQRFNFLAINPSGFTPPANHEGLQKLVADGLLSKEEITDAWGRDFVYEIDTETGKRGMVGQDYRIQVHSVGPDGIDGTADDIGM